MPDVKDMLYSFFLEMDKRFQERYLRKFSDKNYGEPNVWDGTNLHTFYELTHDDENELYVLGNVDKSILHGRP